MNFHIEDFTEINYQDVLKKTLGKFKFSSFPDAFQDNLNSKNIVIWRHDVDFSPQRALALAKIENSIGVKATYYFLLSSEYYNIFEMSIRKCISEISDLGHHIGLHFDDSIYPNIREDQILFEEKLIWEKKILEQITGKKIHTFSFHNPTPETLKNDKNSYGDMLNTYSLFYKNNFSYCSDSNGYWRFKRLFDFIDTASTDQPIQILTHPVWWTKSVMTPFERIKRCAEGRKTNALKGYEDLLSENGRKNII